MTAPQPVEQPAERLLLPEPPMPADLLAYEDGPEAVTMTDRVLGLVVLAPWCAAVWAWSVGVVAHEVVKAVRR